MLAKILETLPVTDKWCVEFGAWDGQHLSNTCNLIEKAGYSAVLIEGNSVRIKDLERRHGKNPKVIGLKRFFGFCPTEGLDVKLDETPNHKDFDLLSIDIDGNDYHVWAAVTAYRPKVVCIEYNPTIPTEIEFVQPADPTKNQGNSLLSLTLLGKKKGYELVAVTPLNAIFVRSEFFPLFGIANNDPRVLREDVSKVTYVFSGYDGTIFVVGGEDLQWHGLKWQKRIRQLPRFFRHLPDYYGPVKSLVYKVYRRLLSACNRG